MEDQSMSGVHKRTRDDGDGEASDSDAASDSNSAMGNNPKFVSDNDQPDFGEWDAGVLYRRGPIVTLCLLNSKKEKIKSRSCQIVVEPDPGMGFAIVESILYAFCDQQDGYAIREFFVCDLKDSTPQFKRGGKLLGPKSYPLLIPYKKKMFIIPTWHNFRLICPITEPMFCEVLHLPLEGKDSGGYGPQRLKTPFDNVYDHDYTLPLSDGFAVSGKYAYIHMYSSRWCTTRLVCLDMDAEIFYFCYDRDPCSFTTRIVHNAEVEIVNGEEYYKGCPCIDTIQPEVEQEFETTFVKVIYGQWKYLSLICRDKLFVVQLSHRHGFEVYVSSNLSNKEQMEKAKQKVSDKLEKFKAKQKMEKAKQKVPLIDEWEEEELEEKQLKEEKLEGEELEGQFSDLNVAHLGLEHLKEVEAHIRAEAKDCRQIIQTWTLPSDAEEENKFSIFICYRSTLLSNSGARDIRFFVCNFELVDQWAETDPIDDAARYKCKILSHALYKDFLPGLQMFEHVFTRGSHLRV
ncbi:hypothetical protein LINGRAHAP2_LOCUS36348 [Linum grandiflorum]